MMPFHLISVNELDIHHLRETLFPLAERYKREVKSGHLHTLGHGARGLILLFYQPSTRTKISFALAAHLIGMPIIAIIDDVARTSEAKAESFANSIRNYCYPGVGIIVLRHPRVGAAKEAAKIAGRERVSIINAGDGSHEHPTQALQDILTMTQLCQAGKDLKLVLAGDITNSRVFRSTLLLALRFFGLRQLGLCAPEGVNLPNDLISTLDENRVQVFPFPRLEDALRWADIIYVGRPQSEYVENPQEYNRKFTGFQITKKMLDDVPANLPVRILHAQPIHQILQEITPDAQDHPRSGIWIQKNNGLFVRMALLDLLSHLYDHHPAVA